MHNKHTSGARRKDYVSHMAIGLFFLIVIFQVLFVTWLPMKLSSEKLWDRQVALQEMIDLQDFLRRFIRGGLKYKDKWQEGEAFMAMLALDAYAKYIRTYEEDLTREQIREIGSNLNKFESHYRSWESGKFYIRFEEIEIEPILQNQLRDYRDWEVEHGSERYP